MSGSEDEASCFLIPVGMKYQWPCKAQTIRHVHEVSLEDLYFGTGMSFASVPCAKLCQKCAGKGCASGMLEICIPCDGTGIGEVDISPDLNVFKVCTSCGGFGEKAPEGGHCQECGGSRLVKGSRRIMFSIDKGYDPDTTPLPFLVRKKGLGNAAACSKVKSGDVEIVIKQKQHAVFSRKAHHLICEHTLSMIEALSGFEFTLTHLDGRELHVKSQLGQVTQPGEYKVIQNEGMPVWHFGSGTQVGVKGNLYVRCHVRLPEPQRSIEKPPSVDLVDAALQKVSLDEQRALEKN